MLKFKSMMSLVLALCMSLSISSISFAADNNFGSADIYEDDLYNGDCGDSVEFSFDKQSGILTIQGEGEMEEYEEDDTVPWFDFCTEIIGLKVDEGVTQVSDYAFNVCDNLKDLVLADTVTTIGKYAFSSCSKLETATLSNNLTKIGKGAFSNCDSLNEIAIPGGVTEIEEEAFACCASLKTVTLSDGLTKISDIAFIDCTSLTELILPEGLTKISEGAFDSCEGLTILHVPNSLKTVEEGAFNGCKSLSQVYYNGSKSQWNNISIAESNTELVKANRTYSISEDDLSKDKDKDDEKYDDDDDIPSEKNKTVIKLSYVRKTVYRLKGFQIPVKINNPKGKTTFTSSDTNVCTVSKKGYVSTVSKGKANITISNNGVKKELKVTVINPTLNKKSIKLKVKKTFTIKIKGKVGKATFTSNKIHIAKVNKNGKVTAQKKGKAVITVTTNGIKLKFKVNVYKK